MLSFIFKYVAVIAILIPYLHPMALLSRNTAYSRVTALAGLRPLHAAFRWLHLNGRQMLRWQAELVAIPAPPFGEEARSLWMVERFGRAGLTAVEKDEIGNVFGMLAASSGADPDAQADGDSGPVVLISAHLDTVFPAGTVLEPVVNDDRLEAPGACDNAAGVIGMLGLAHALVEAKMPLAATLVFVGNVGEEGEGDLRGVRHIYQHSRYAQRIAAHIVLDGGGAETAVTQALGSRRFQITVRGPGGHSFTDAGVPNPILVLATALTALAQTPLNADAAAGGDSAPARSTLNIGTIQGGTSVNSIPDYAVATVDFRSTDVAQLLRLEVTLHRAVEDAAEAANATARTAGKGFVMRRAMSRDRDRDAAGQQTAQQSGRITFSIEKIGDRPAASLPLDSPLLEALRGVDRHLGLRTDLRLASTDANIPLSLGVPALSLGAGGEGGGAHTRAEWYSAVNRELGLRRVLLLALAMLEWAAGKD